jgi:hypothetical protein
MGTIVIPLSNQCLTDGGKVSTGIHSMTVFTFPP